MCFNVEQWTQIIVPIKELSSFIAPASSEATRWFLCFVLLCFNLYKVSSEGLHWGASVLITRGSCPVSSVPW